MEAFRAMQELDVLFQDCHVQNSRETSDKYHGCHANDADGKGGVQVHGEKWAENE